MEQEHSQENFIKQEDVEKKEVLSVEQLPEKLGFFEPQEVAGLHNDLLSRDLTDQNAGYLVDQYSLAIEESGVQGRSAEQGIGLILQIALIHKQAGRTALYQEALQNAKICAYDMYLDDICTVIEKELGQE